ncbi:MAG: hypothetical protein K6D56_07090 [Clostridia bacterium]|nr:hypothetical protein [Clostridia bacterium]
MFVDIFKILEDLLSVIGFMIRELEAKDNIDLPEGRLRKRESSVYTAYDLVTSTDGAQRSRCLGGDRSKEVLSFKSRVYNRTLYNVLVRDRTVAEKMLRIAKKGFRRFDPASIDAMLKPAYIDHTGMVNKNPAFMSDADWLRTPYWQSSRQVDPGRSYVTCDGTAVRSKGEMIIYNILVYLGVPFRYEEVITLTDVDGRKVNRCPDFIIRRPDGREVILEYLGMLGDEKYAADNFEKFMLYWRNGYVLNDTLFYVMDDVNGVLNSEVVMDLIKHSIMLQ